MRKRGVTVTPWALPSDPRIAAGQAFQLFDPDEASLACTSSRDCKAAADKHLDTCPVEAALKAEFGF